MNVVFLLSNQNAAHSRIFFCFGTATLTGGGRKMENVLHLTEIHTFTENIYIYVQVQLREFHLKIFTQPFWNVFFPSSFSPL